jgi:ethanolamine utilization microcompartment shell protein EutS
MKLTDTEATPGKARMASSTFAAQAAQSTSMLIFFFIDRFLGSVLFFGMFKAERDDAPDVVVIQGIYHLLAVAFELYKFCGLQDPQLMAD